MKIYVEQAGNRTDVYVPPEWVAAINLPPGVAAETAFTDRKEWADFLFYGPMNVISKDEIKSVSMVRLSDLPACTNNEFASQCQLETDDLLCGDRIHELKADLGKIQYLYCLNRGDDLAVGKAIGRYFKGLAENMAFEIVNSEKERLEDNG